MNRRHFLAASAGLIGCSRQTKPRLNVYNWSDYFGKTTLADFERETGIEVRYSSYESNEELLAKVFSGNSGWDIVFPSNYYIQPLVENRLLAPLRHEWLPGIANLDPMLSKPAWDPELTYCVPYMWGSTGILYRKPASGAAPAAWADLWDERFRGRLTMLDDPAEALGAALKKLGHSLNTADPGELARAKAELIAQKRIVRAYLNAEARDQVVAGDLLAAHLWATTSSQAIEAAPQLGFAFPREGFPLYADCAVILRESTRVEAAHRFIDYLLRPRVAADIVAFSKTSTANAEARKLLPEAISGNPVLYPGEEVLRRGEWFATLPAAAQRLRDRIWTEVKSA
ncbi:MAG: spermidine/putrescine ABC transporter substrate-binding protein [Bryobacteraceae bacterium]